MKKVLILGGDGAIGSAICREFRRNGWRVLAPSPKDCDLASPDAVEAYLARCAAGLTGVEALVHSAGINEPGPFEKVPQADFQRVLQVNTLSFVRIMRHLAPEFKRRRRGRILAISSLYGGFSRAGRMPYALSKHGLNGAVKTAALELGPYGVLANTLSPGFVDTPLTRKNNGPSVIRSFEERIPLGFLAAPADIAKAAYFLCSPQNTYITGQDIVADGGYSAGGFQK